MSRKAFWLIFAAAIVLIPAATFAYWMLPQWKLIADVTKESELVLHPRKHQNMVYGIEIQVYGQIDGEAELVWIEGGKPYRTLKLSDAVDVRIFGEWYADEAKLSYKPLDVTGGYLKLRYKFFPSYPTDSAD
jgi:hypothetical protein